MSDFFEILKYVIPAGIVFATSYYLLKMFFDNEKRKDFIEIKKESQKVSMPIRLQAYERMVLFLERISPDNLVMRTANPRLNAQQMQLDLISTVRTEFEHNMSQQLYMSDEAWRLVKNSKEEVIRLINTAMGQLNDNASAIDLSSKVIELYSVSTNYPTTVTLEFLKKEIRMVF